MATGASPVAPDRQGGHRYRQPRREGGVDRRTVPRVEGVHGWRLDHRSPGSRRRAQTRRPGVEGIQPEDRSATLPPSMNGFRVIQKKAYRKPA